MPAQIRIPFRPSRPTVLATLFLAAMIVGCSQPDTSDPGIAERIKPVATFVLGESAPAAPEAAPEAAATPPATENAADSAAPPVAVAGQKDGATVYAQLCKTCHDQGLIGAPKFGDHTAWEPRIATGIEALYQSSLKGKNAMPPKGGNGSLKDEEVKSAVDYMVAAAN